MLTRRTLLAGSGATSFTLGARDDAKLPRATLNAYGLDPIIGANEPLERVLRELGEPRLTPGRAAPPVFRLLEIHSFRKPRCIRVAFEASGEASGFLKQVGQDTMLASFSQDHGVRLRALMDDRERFWDAAPHPPDWDQIDAEAAGMVRITGDGGSALLEARVGGRHHALLRRNPEPDTLLGELSPLLFSS